MERKLEEELNINHIKMKREYIEDVLEAERNVEAEIRQDGNDPDDFDSDEWVDMISEELDNPVAEDEEGE